MSLLSGQWVYVALSYALSLGCMAVLAIDSLRRLRKAKTRLAIVEEQRERSAS